MRLTLASRLVPALMTTLLAAGPAVACSCLPATPARAHAGASAVVLGRIVSVAERGPLASRATVEVRQAWKATVESTIEVVIGGPCAASLPLGQEQLLFLERIEGGYATQACSGNQVAAGAGGFLTWLGRNARQTR